MRTHIFTFILAALPLASTAQANEISMDASGMRTGSSTDAYASSANADCASAGSLHADEPDATSGNGGSDEDLAGSSSTRMRVSDETDQAAGTESTTGGSATGKSLAVPLKSRSTRWQSLVPGAIK